MTCDDMTFYEFVVNIIMIVFVIYIMFILVKWYKDYYNTDEMKSRRNMKNEKLKLVIEILKKELNK